MPDRHDLLPLERLGIALRLHGPDGPPPVRRPARRVPRRVAVPAPAPAPTRPVLAHAVAALAADVAAGRVPPERAPDVVRVLEVVRDLDPLLPPGRAGAAAALVAALASALEEIRELACQSEADRLVALGASLTARFRPAGRCVRSDCYALAA